MAFLDNSGDIILDAVLTDTGRMRLAKGDGTFKIVKFALGDDEIDYGLFDKNDSRGSAYYDLEIMQTPILEAFTNNTSLLKHKLLSMPQTNLIYLPTIKINDTQSSYKAAVIPSPFNGNSNEITATEYSADENLNTLGKGIYFLPADDDTETALNDVLGHGVLSNEGVCIRAHQGLDTTEISHTRPIDGNLKETQYIVQVDNRFAKLTQQKASGNQASVSYIDDDQIASYYFSTQDLEYVGDLNINPANKPSRIIRGPQGTYMQFSLYRSLEIESSTYLFDEFGGGAGSVMTIDSVNYLYIDTTVRVTGATTGNSIDIPIRVMKKQ